MLVQDEIEATKADVWWFMHTQADVILQDGGRSAMLSLGGKKLEARIESPESARFEVRPAEPLPTSPNPAGQKSNSGLRKLSVHLSAAGNMRLSVVFLPPDGESEVFLPRIRPLSEWRDKDL